MSHWHVPQELTDLALKQCEFPYAVKFWDVWPLNWPQPPTGLHKPSWRFGAVFQLWPGCVQNIKKTSDWRG